MSGEFTGIVIGFCCIVGGLALTLLSVAVEGNKKHIKFTGIFSIIIIVLSLLAIGLVYGVLLLQDWGVLT